MKKILIPIFIVLLILLIFIVNKPKSRFEQSPFNENFLKHDFTIILYRNGCPSCDLIYDDIKNIQKRHPNKNIYFIESRSIYGKKLVDEYNIEEVPAMITKTKRKLLINQNLIRNDKLNQDIVNNHLEMQK